MSDRATLTVFVAAPPQTPADPATPAVLVAEAVGEKSLDPSAADRPVTFELRPSRPLAVTVGYGASGDTAGDPSARIA